jgi:hypothetical protein
MFGQQSTTTGGLFGTPKPTNLFGTTANQQTTSPFGQQQQGGMLGGGSTGGLFNKPVCIFVFCCIKIRQN